MMDQQRLNYLTARLANSQISRAEYDELMQYIRQGQDHRLLQEAMDLADDHKDEDEVLSQHQAEQLYQRILCSELFIAPQKKKSANTIVWWSIAASIMILSSLAYYFFPAGNRQITKQTHTIRSQQIYISRKVPDGQRAKVNFPDGTTVWINSGSELRYPQNYNDAPREVYLKGEAYFEVASVPGKPFTVHTGRVSTTVLGTAFNVQSYLPEKLNITVSSGKVKVSERKKELAILSRDKQIIFNSISNKSTVKTVKADEFASWRKGELILNDVSLAEAANIISRQYNVRIIFTGQALKKCRFSASFLKGENVGKIIQVISQLNGFHYQIQGRKITLSGQGC